VCVALDLTQEAITLRVVGHPEPGGSKTWMPVKVNGSYRHAADGRPIGNMVDANPKAKRWQRTIRSYVTANYGGALLRGPLIVTMDFYLHRWKSHYGTGRNARILKRDAPLYPGGDHADSLKLARPVEDALTGVLWEDDAYTVDLLSRKRYAPGFVLKGMVGEYVVIRVMAHDFATVGERALADQGSLLPA
jgi:Holliday junction resolvase RusA-like endonuclease